MSVGDLIRRIVMEPRKGELNRAADPLEPLPAPPVEPAQGDLANAPGKPCECGNCGCKTAITETTIRTA